MGQEWYLQVNNKQPEHTWLMFMYAQSHKLAYCICLGWNKKIPYSIKLLKPRDLSNDPLTRNLGPQNSKCESFQSHNVLWIFPAKLGTRGIFIETSVKHVCKSLVIEFVTFVINP